MLQRKTIQLEIGFDLDIPNVDAEKILTLGDAVNYIKKLIER